MENYTPARTITKIEANPILSSRKDEYRRLRVAAYCRVSTDEEDQLNSLETQMQYYTSKIAENPNWTMVGIIEQLEPHIREISFRTYYRKRKEAIDAFSSVLWGYTSRDSFEILDKFFPKNENGT